MIDKRPALIARCRNTADVVEAVDLAQKLGLQVAVRGGGHNVAGRSTIDGGLMIDLATMKGIHVDPKARTVRVQGGATWADLNRETQLHGLAVTGGVVSSTGVAGLTLGGGLGWLMGKHGLALDNLRSVELVTAEGKVLRASKDEEPELFWALRGGGGNFGVATSFEFQLHPVGPTVIGGLIAHPFDRARECSSSIATPRSPCRTSTPCSAAWCMRGWIGREARGHRRVLLRAGGRGREGDAAAQAVRRAGHGCGRPDPLQPAQRHVGRGLPEGRAQLLEVELPQRAERPGHRYDGVVLCRVPHADGGDAAGALPRCGDPRACRRHRLPAPRGGRQLPRRVAVDGPADSARCVAWARETYAAMQPHFAAGRYVNYLGDDEAGDPVAAAYGANYRRLQEIKTKYNPKNSST